MRIALVNDVPMAIEAMRRIVVSSPEHQIAWTAMDGAQALAWCRRDRPDLILMDLIMPHMNGVEATSRIMAECPCAIVVVTASVSCSCSAVFQAMGAGALDAVNTPVLEHLQGSTGGAQLLAKIETVRRLIGPATPKAFLTPRSAAEAASPEEHLIAIGASAGGPAALAAILAGLPRGFSCPIVVVQHVDAEFAPALASWLNDQSALEVRLARTNDMPRSGTVLLAAGDKHLVLTERGTLTYAAEPAECLYQPSVDVFFTSVRDHWSGGVTGVLLTGMGRDGAQGLLELRRAGHVTIAQDQTSSAVYGMPKAAAQLDAASEILSLERIGSRIRGCGTTATYAHA